MISHLPLRLAASALTLAVVLSPTVGHCQTANAVPAVIAAPVKLPHISVMPLGAGSPVVLIPGLATPRAVWRDTVAQLAANHRVIVVQVNGFAGDAPDANLQPGVLDGVVADLHAYLTREKLTGAAVVGHSLGGLVALKLAIAYPGDAGRLMIVDSLPFFGAIFGPGLTPAMLEPRGAAMRDQLKASYGKPADAAAAQATAERLALKPDSRAKVQGWAMKADPRVVGEAMYEDLTTDVTADLPKITVPVTLVVPYNAALPQAQVDALYRGAYKGTPHLNVVEVADSAHFVMLDQPTAFAKALADFLAN